jgi:uncharacterized protein CbrC (UPF0167 family)
MTFGLIARCMVALSSGIFFIVRTGCAWCRSPCSAADVKKCAQSWLLPRDGRRFLPCQLPDQVRQDVGAVNGRQWSREQCLGQCRDVVSIVVDSVGVAARTRFEEHLDELAESKGTFRRKGATGLDPVLLVAFPRLGFASSITGTGGDELAT